MLPQKKRSHLLRLSKQSHFFIQDKRRRRRRDGHMSFPSERHFFHAFSLKGKRKKQQLKLNVMRDLVHLIVFRTTHKAAKGLERDTESTTFYMVHVHFYFVSVLFIIFLSGNSLGLGGLVQGEE